jgi:hypothetical protein
VRPGRYREAGALYTASIERWGRDPAAYTNRALCRIRCASRGACAGASRADGGEADPDGGGDGGDGERLLRAARDDCDAALALDGACVRAYERRGDRCAWMGCSLWRWL